MSKPPGNYSELSLSTICIPKGTKFYRCYNSERDLTNAIFFAIDGKPVKTVYSGRYGDVERIEGVCYLGLNMDVAIAETLLQKNMIYKGVARSKLDQLRLMHSTFTKDVTFVNFSGTSLHKNHVDASVPTGPHSISREYSSAILRNVNHYDGIYWRSRINNDEHNIALFERAKSAFSERIDHGCLSDSHIIDHVAQILLNHGVYLY